MAFGQEISDGVFVVNHFEFLDGDDGFSPLGSMDDSVSAFADFLLELQFIEIDVQIRIEHAEIHVLKLICTFNLKFLLRNELRLLLLLRQLLQF